ncbi:MAG: hypothetical protein JWM80_5772 [Cyanobacteria bacterium RYN_339]|nr:hypothetical protein [Cyanobacteria bacterium RYN_339]
MPVSVRISEATSTALDALVKATGKSKVKLLEEAVLAAGERAFWEGFDDGYARDGKASRTELTAWDGALADGLPTDEAAELAAWQAADQAATGS